MIVRAGLIVAALLLAGCAGAPRPRVLSDVDAVAEGAQAKQAAELAPQAHAHAVLLKKHADEAYRAGDRAGAQILGEQALAAYSHAFVLGRLAKAERELGKAEAELAKAKTELADLDEKQKRVGAEADEIELRIRVAEDALPLAPNAPGSAEREKARLDAARALASQARLLCMATRLLDPKRDGLDADVAKLGELDKTLAGSPKATPIDAAIQLRSACLKHLTLARRPATRAAPGSGLADSLLAELSRSGELHPFRDDRGVVVTLRGVFSAAGAIVPEATKLLEALANVAKAHPEFPVLVVVHSNRAGKEGDKRAKAVADALVAAGAPRAEPAHAGSATPLVDPARPGAAARNERVEIVFVSPAS